MSAPLSTAAALPDRQSGDGEVQAKLTPAPVVEELLHPGERLALTIARAQIARGERPGINTATVCIAALARLAGDPLPDWPIP